MNYGAVRLGDAGGTMPTVQRDTLAAVLSGTGENLSKIEEALFVIEQKLGLPSEAQEKNGQPPAPGVLGLAASMRNYSIRLAAMAHRIQEEL